MAKVNFNKMFEAALSPLSVPGGRVIKSIADNPMRSLGAVGTAAAFGYASADMGGHENRGEVTQMAAVGAVAGLTAPGGAAIMSGVGAAGMGVAATVGGAAMMLGDKALKVPSKNLKITELHEAEFTKLGKSLLAGGAVIEGASRAVDKFYQIRQGAHDGMMRTNSPTVPQIERRKQDSYSNNGGATGDLVFSLYNNRN